MITLMNLYFLLFGLFLVQEPVSTNVALVEAYQHGYNVWVIHALFVVATLIDIAVGYYAGMFIKTKLPHGKLERWIEAKKESLPRYAKHGGVRMLLFFGGPVIFPFSALLPPWLGLSFAESALYLFLGELLFWYAGEWLVVLGIKAFVPDPIVALGAAVVVMLAITYGFTYLWKRTYKKHS